MKHLLTALAAISLSLTLAAPASASSIPGGIDVPEGCYVIAEYPEYEVWVDGAFPYVHARVWGEPDVQVVCPR